MRFNVDEMRKVMPSDSFYVTILRDPAEMFESAFYYFYYDVPSFRNGPKREDLNAIEIWLNNTNNYFDPHQRAGFWFYAKNHVMFDLGYNALMEDDSEIKKQFMKSTKYLILF